MLFSLQLDMQHDCTRVEKLIFGNEIKGAENKFTFKFFLCIFFVKPKLALQ